MDIKKILCFTLTLRHTFWYALLVLEENTALLFIVTSSPTSPRMFPKPHKSPFFLSHAPKNVLLILLSLSLLPLTPMAILLSVSLCLLQRLFSYIRRLAKASGPRKTILITGVSMTKGLALVRILHKHAHHRIVAAEYEPIFCALSSGRFSCAVSKFHRLKSPLSGPSDPEERNMALYITSLLRVIEVETVDLWISCSGVASSVEDGGWWR